MGKRSIGTALIALLSRSTIGGCGVTHKEQSTFKMDKTSGSSNESITNTKNASSHTAHQNNGNTNLTISRKSASTENNGETNKGSAVSTASSKTDVGVVSNDLNASSNADTVSSSLANTGDANNSTDNVTDTNTSTSTSTEPSKALSTDNRKVGQSTQNAHFVPEIFSVPAGEVALTIDDGPSPYTEQIISVLNEFHVKATFFFVGSEVKQFPDAVRMAVQSGEEIGDHTEDHPELTHLSKAAQAQEIEECKNDIALYDPLPITLFRPPYELMNHNTLDILANDHMALALWNRDPKDWAAKTPKQIVNAILDDNPSGGVFDLHDKQMTLQALPEILSGLEAQHLKIVLLPEPFH